MACKRTWLAKEHGLRKDVTCVSEETCGVARRQAKGMPFMEAGKDTYLPCRKCGKYGRNDGSMAVNHGTPARYDVKGDRRTRVFQDPGRQNPGLSGYGQAGPKSFRIRTGGAGPFRIRTSRSKAFQETDSLHRLLRYIDYLTVFEFVSYTYTFAPAAFLRLVLGRSVTINLIPFLYYYLHVFLAWVLDHREVLLTEHFGHIETGHQSDHKGYGKNHSDIEEVSDHAHGIIVIILAEKSAFHVHFPPSITDDTYSRRFRS